MTVQTVAYTAHDAALAISIMINDATADIETADMAAYIYQRDRWPRRYRVRHARIGAAPPRDAFTFRGALRIVKRWQRRGVR